MCRPHIRTAGATTRRTMTSAPMALVLFSMAFPASAGAQSGRFSDLHRMLPANDGSAHATALADVDGDGDLDVLIGAGRSISGSTFGEPNHLYLNDGDGILSDATQNLPNHTDTTVALAFGDVDGDGDLDLFVANAGQNRLYLNDGAGVFSDATTQLPATAQGNSYAVALGDVDGDGDLDALVGNFWFEQNQLFENDGSGTFLDVSGRLPVDTDPTLAVALGDVDGDGDLDAFTGNGFDGSPVPNRLYLNDGAGNFSDATSRLPQLHDSTTVIALGDLDADGDLDAFVGNGNGDLGGTRWQSRLYLNDGAGNFSDGTSRLPQVLGDITAVALGDVDGDGDLDALIANADFTIPSPHNRLYLSSLGCTTDPW